MLQYAAEEADRLSHDHVGTEHLLLGLLREEGSVAAEVLAARGLTIEAGREAIVELLGRGEHRNCQARRRRRQTPTMAADPVRPRRERCTSFIPECQWCFTDGFTLEEITFARGKGAAGTSTSPLLPQCYPQQETVATCLGLLRSAIEQHFAVQVTRETNALYRLTATTPLGSMLWRYPDPERGWACSMVEFSVFMGRSKDAPIFPLEGFAVHSVPFMFLVKWFEEILGGQVIDETGLPGIYGFELKERVDTPEALIELLRDKAGLLITREQRETPTLVVR